MSLTIEDHAPDVIEAAFERRLDRVLARCIDGYDRLISCERLSGGANQETYRLVIAERSGERSLSMRRAAGGIGATQESINIGLRTEARLFQVAREAGVPSPEIHYVLEPTDELGDGFIMSWLDGETLGARIVRAEEFADVRPRLAEQCGRILARIHAIDVASTGLAKDLTTTTAAEFVNDTWTRYRSLNTPQPMIDYTACWLLEHLPDATRSCLVHNDFRNGNLMIDRTGIIGVLDWEIAHIGDPMRDLGWLCTNSWRFGESTLPVGGFGDYDSLIAGYEAGSGITVDRAHLHFWEVFGSFWWAVGCLAMAARYREGPDRSVEHPAIGRRSSECQTDCLNLIIPGPVELVDPPAPFDDGDLPRSGELIDSVREFLRNEIMATTRGRTKFLARVAGNSLDIVQRELALGAAARAAERSSLSALLGCSGDLAELRWQLVNGLRDGSITTQRNGLAAHLRNTVVNRLAIDQPTYSAFRVATQMR